MTVLDDEVAKVAAGIERLSTRGVAALFAACASGLRPAFSDWAALRHAHTEALLDVALGEAIAFAKGGPADAIPRDLLPRLEGATPTDEAPTVAQDCWICADTAIRVIVDWTFRAGPVIWYALEPMVQATTERLFGVSEVGSGPDEDARLAAVLRDDRLDEALAFCHWAVQTLEGTPVLDDQTIAVLQARAGVLMPD